jgi:hypothetical protein
MMEEGLTAQGWCGYISHSKLLNCKVLRRTAEESICRIVISVAALLGPLGLANPPAKNFCGCPWLLHVQVPLAKPHIGDRCGGVISAHKRLRQEDCKFQASLGKKVTETIPRKQKGWRHAWLKW